MSTTEETHLIICAVSCLLLSVTSKATHNTHKKYKGKMSSTRDIRDFYKTSNNKIPPFLTSGSGSLNQAELHAISEEVKSSVKPRKHYNISVPEWIKNEVGTKSALEKFNTKYPQYTFVRTSVNNWKKKTEDD